MYGSRPPKLWQRQGNICVHLGLHRGNVEAILGPSWAILGLSRGVLWQSCGHLGPSWGCLGVSWGHLGPFWAVLGPSWGHLGPSWGHHGAIWAPSCGHIGAILMPCWVHCRVMWVLVRLMLGRACCVRCAECVFSIIKTNYSKVPKFKMMAIWALHHGLWGMSSHSQVFRTRRAGGWLQLGSKSRQDGPKIGFQDKSRQIRRPAGSSARDPQRVVTK
jgi:hypothetical protein